MPSAAGAQPAPGTDEKAAAAAWLAQQGIVPPSRAPLDAAKSAATSKPTAPAAPEVSAIGIAELLGYRHFLGNDQWEVRWEGEDPDSSTWETWPVLDTDGLRQHAQKMKDAHES